MRLFCVDQSSLHFLAQMLLHVNASLPHLRPPEGERKGSCLCSERCPLLEPLRICTSRRAQTISTNRSLHSVGTAQVCGSKGKGGTMCSFPWNSIWVDCLSPRYSCQQVFLDPHGEFSTEQLPELAAVVLLEAFPLVVLLGFLPPYHLQPPA